jgi:hypothetical protein
MAQKRKEKVKMATCNHRVVGRCKECGAEIKIGWSIDQSQALMDSGFVAQSASEQFSVIEKCEHIPYDGGYGNDGYDMLMALVIPTSG